MKGTGEHGTGNAWLMGGSRQAFDRGLLAGSATLGAIVGLDVALSVVFVAAYPLAAVVASAFSLGATVAVWALCLVLAGISVLWNHDTGAFDYWLRIVIVAGGGGFAALLAYRRARAEAVSARLVLLDVIGSTADGSLPLNETIDRALAGIVPAAADFCMIDVIHDAEVFRVAVRARGVGRWQEIEEGLRAREPSTPSWLRDPEIGIPAVPYFLPRVSRGHEEILAHGPDGDLEFIRSLGLRSVVIAPMVARGRLLGTLTMAVAWSGRRYGDDDLAFARALASRVAMALENAGLFSDLESVERRMDAVMSKIPEGVTVHDPSGNLVFANRTFASWLGFDSAEEVVAVGLDGLRDRLELYDEQGQRLEQEEGDLIAARVRTGALPFRRMLHVITRVDGRERWLMVSADAIRGPGGDVLYAVTTMQDVTETKRAELSQRVIAGATELLSMGRELRPTLQRVAELAVPDLADWCSFNLLDDDGTIEQVALAHVNPERRRLASELRRRAPARAGDGSMLAKVIAEERPHRYDIGDPSTDSHAGDFGRTDAIRVAGLGPAITVPIRGGGRVAGTLTLANTPGRRRLTDADVAIAAEMAERAAVSIENARLARARREIAETLQHGLLPPKIPLMAGWDVAAMYRPAGELNEVGGDFYDAFEVENGWMVVVGDVVGRGAKAAALTALARHTINTACTVTGDPREALSLLNRKLLRRGDQPLCTAAIVVLSRGTDRAADAVVVSAGHPLPLLVRRDGVGEVCRPGPMLGAMADAEWHLDLVSVEPGEQLVIYTDGVTDSRVDGELVGEARLRARLEGASDPAKAIERIETLLSEVDGDGADDAAAVAIMRSPEPPVRPPEAAAETRTAS